MYERRSEALERKIEFANMRHQLVPRGIREAERTLPRGTSSWRTQRTRCVWSTRSALPWIRAESCRFGTQCPRGDRKGRPKGGHSMATKKGAWAGGFWEALTYAWMRRPGIRVVPCTAYESSSASAPGPSSHEQSVPGPHPWRHMGDDRGDDVATRSTARTHRGKTVLKTA
jgi:hypothetical protein